MYLRALSWLVRKRYLVALYCTRVILTLGIGFVNGALKTKKWTVHKIHSSLLYCYRIVIKVIQIIFIIYLNTCNKLYLRLSILVRVTTCYKVLNHNIFRFWLNCGSRETWGFLANFFLIFSELPRSFTYLSLLLGHYHFVSLWSSSSLNFSNFWFSS